VKLKDLGEFKFIDRITPGCDVGGRAHVIKGIGDDAAVTRVRDGVQLVTTDLLVERVHFLRGTISPFQLGYKALAVNLSDIAAMGGTPLDAYISIAVPAEVPVEELDAIYDGMKELARAAEVNLLGGDTTGSKEDLCINIVVTGHAQPDEVLYRSGARVGDTILVTGTLGDSAGGLQVILTDPSISADASAALLRAHYEPEMYLEEARIFATSGAVHAAIDLSDGLASDLRHVCEASGVGAVVDLESIPLSSDLEALCAATDADPFDLALSGGEDYRLLVTADASATADLQHEITESTGRQLHSVGQIIHGDGIQIRRSDGSLQALSGSGWDHFKTSASSDVHLDSDR
jgi:thiamine-monophosphate kinase